MSAKFCCFFLVGLDFRIPRMRYQVGWNVEAIVRLPTSTRLGQILQFESATSHADL